MNPSQRKASRGAASGAQKLWKRKREDMDSRRTVLLADANEEFRGMLREAIEKLDSEA